MREPAQNQQRHRRAGDVPSRRVFLVEILKSRARGIEVDGADVAAGFLRDHCRAEAEACDAWLAIALHTTWEVPLRLAPGKAVVLAHPRPDFNVI